MLPQSDSVQLFERSSSRRLERSEFRTGPWRRAAQGMTGRVSGRARGIRVAFFASFLGDARKEGPTLQRREQMCLSKRNISRAWPISATPRVRCTNRLMWGRSSPHTALRAEIGSNLPHRGGADAARPKRFATQAHPPTDYPNRHHRHGGPTIPLCLAEQHSRHGRKRFSACFNHLTRSSCLNGAQAFRLERSEFWTGPWRRAAQGMPARVSGRARGIRVAFFASFLGDARKEEPTLQR